jgi:plasmid stability protein
VKTMTVTLELKPEVEARVAAQAAAHGMSVEAYIQSVLESLAVTQDEPTFETMTSEERARAWDEWLNSDDGVTGPAFLDDSRESIYREREDSQL